MSNAHAALQHQLAACQAMMQLFQQERQHLHEDGGASLRKVKDNMQIKRRLADAIAASVHQLGSLGPAELEPADRQAMTTEIAQLLEQLLVIEQENERALRAHVERQQQGPGSSASRPVPRRPGFSPSASRGFACERGQQHQSNWRSR